MMVRAGRFPAPSTRSHSFLHPVRARCSATRQQQVHETNLTVKHASHTPHHTAAGNDPSAARFQRQLHVCCVSLPPPVNTHSITTPTRPCPTLMRSRLTSLRSRSATASTARTQISAICRFSRPTLQNAPARDTEGQRVYRTQLHAHSQCVRHVVRHRVTWRSSTILYKPDTKLVYVSTGCPGVHPLVGKVQL